MQAGRANNQSIYLDVYDFVLYDDPSRLEGGKSLGGNNSNKKQYYDMKCNFGLLFHYNTLSV